MEGEVSDGHMFQSLKMIYIRGATAAKLLVVQILRYICYQGQHPAARTVHRDSLVTQSQCGRQCRGGKSWHPGTVRWEIAQEYLKFESQFSRIKKGFYDIWKNY